MPGKGPAPVPKTSDKLVHPSIICAENIALLHLLHSVPTLPSSNPLDMSRIRHDGYTLPFAKERELVSTLAFLSNAADDPDHVPALCVQEDRGSSSLQILLAVNRLSYNDGSQVLQEMERGFKNIFATMSRVSAEYDRGKVEDDILTATVSMNSLRIRRRLRFTPGKRGNTGQSINVLLQEAVSHVSQLGKKKLGIQALVIQSFTERAKAVIRLAQAWAQHQTSARLKDIVEGIYHLAQLADLQALLEKIPNQLMDPSSRQSLYNIVSKVARYREAARFLRRIAHKIELARRMTVLIVNLPEAAFQRASVNEYTPTLASTITRISARHRQEALVHVCRRLGSTELRSNEEFTAQTKRTMKEAKIHAEIQLLYYCEVNAFEHPPRILCSSKNACFLCNAFIQVHGKLHMPRHHGRLYPAWRLPFGPQLEEATQRFNSLLENQARDSLKTLLEKKRKSRYPDPNESTLLSLPASLSTLRSAVLSDVSNRAREALQAGTVEETVAVRPPSLPPDTRTLLRSTEDLGDASTLSTTQTRAASAETGADIESSKHSAPHVAPQKLCPPQQAPCEGAADDNEELIQGVMLLRSIKLNGKAPIYTAGTFEIHIEHVIDESLLKSANASKAIGYGIEWLTVERARRVREKFASSIIAAEALQHIMSHQTNEQHSLFISAREAIVKILLQPSFA